MRILIADDDPFLLRPLAAFLTVKRPGWQIVTATDGVEALRILRAEDIDLLVSDIAMPAMDGMQLLEAVRSDPRLRGLPLIFATGRNDRASVRDGMASGADDYITKPFTGDELVAAIEARMQRFHASGGPADHAAPSREQLHRMLTEREIEVLALIGEGLVTKDIAARLGVSPNTVSVFRASIMRKLDLHNSAALAALAVRARLS